MANPPKIPGLDAFIDKNPGTAKLPTPRTVKTAAVLLVLAACVQAVATVIAIIYAVSPERLVLLEAQLATMSGSVPSLESLRNMGVITLVMAGIATICAYLLFAYFLNKGRAWARMAAGILIALTLVQLVGISFPAGYTTVLQLVLGGLAVALCHLPGANKFFTQVKAARK